MSQDLTYHCDECKARNELADKIEASPTSYLRQHPTNRHISEHYEQLELFHDRRN
jgi:hypothetical protein